MVQDTGGEKELKMPYKIDKENKIDPNDIDNYERHMKLQNKQADEFLNRNMVDYELEEDAHDCGFPYVEKLT